MHIGRGLYYGSYRTPRVAVWTIGVIILILMMAIAFLGYVLPYGQMSLWGGQLLIMQGMMVPLATKPDKIFMSKFMGLVDGDGYIEIGPQKQYNKSSNIPKSTIRVRLVIRLHSRDMALLSSLKEVLGVGSISSLNSINQTRLIFTKKDLSTTIIPLIKLYNLKFLTFNRLKQYALLSYILDNNIIHWEDVQYTPIVFKYSVEYLLNLDFFAGWCVGFTIAEGSFGIKSNGSAFYSIKQKGLYNYNIIKAICFLVAERESKPIKADSSDCYQLTLSSISDVQKVVNFFSSPNNLLFGHKLVQYKLWLMNLKNSKRYKDIQIPLDF